MDGFPLQETVLKAPTNFRSGFPGLFEILKLVHCSKVCYLQDTWLVEDCNSDLQVNRKVVAFQTDQEEDAAGIHLFSSLRVQTRLFYPASLQTHSTVHLPQYTVYTQTPVFLSTRLIDPSSK